MMTRLECMTPIVKFKTSMLKSSSCDYSDTFILVKEPEHLQTQEQQQTQIT